MRHVISVLPSVKCVAVALTLSCGAMIGCAHQNASAPLAKAGTRSPALPGAQGPVIVRLVSRHYTVVISAGAKSPVYTIRNAAGDLLASDVTLDQLRDTRVDLYDQLAPLISPEGSASARVQWAGVER